LYGLSAVVGILLGQAVFDDLPGFGGVGVGDERNCDGEGEKEGCESAHSGYSLSLGSAAGADGRRDEG
jgi:hypothetical protein